MAQPAPRADSMDSKTIGGGMPEHIEKLAGVAPAMKTPRAAAWSAQRRQEWLASAAIAIVLIGALELAARNQWISAMIVAAPSRVMAVLAEGIADGIYLRNLAASMGALVAGFGLAFVVAVVTAGVLSSSRFLERVLTPYIVAFQSMPKVAIAPLVVLWLGFGELSKIAIVAIVCFFPMMVNTLQGLRNRNVDHYELLQSLGASRWQQFWKLRLPHAVPYIFAGVRIGATFARLGVAVAALVGTNSGVGFAMLQAKAQFDVPGVYACLVLLMLMGLTLNALTTVCERWVAARMGTTVDGAGH